MAVAHERFESTVRGSSEMGFQGWSTRHRGDRRYRNDTVAPWEGEDSLLKFPVIVPIIIRPEFELLRPLRVGGPPRHVENLFKIKADFFNTLIVHYFLTFSFCFRAL